MAEYVARKTMAELKSNAPKGAATFKRGAGHNRLVINFDDGRQGYLYHETVVAEIDRKAGTVKLDCGGWRTKTTADAMNEALHMWGINGAVCRRRGQLVFWRRDGTEEKPFASDGTFEVRV